MNKYARAIADVAIEAAMEQDKRRKKGIFLCDSVSETYPGTGRNDLCPCGSNIKYKKCCLNKEKE